MDQPELVSATSWLHWLSFVKYAGGIMVVVGVAAEVLGDWFSEPYQKKIEDARKLEIVQLSKEAATAKSSIAQANARAAEAQLELKKLKTPRAFSDEQAARFIEKMSKYKGQSAPVGASPVTFESASFALQVSKALSAAGMNSPIGQEAISFQIGLVRGVVVKHVTGNDKGKQFAEALAAALNAEGFTASPLEGLMESIMEAGIKQGRGRNDPTNEIVMIGVGEKT